MENPAKCILLPIDGTDQSLRPVSFIKRLYGTSGVDLILCYFSPPAPSSFAGGIVSSADLSKQKKESLERQHHETRRILDRARQVLIREGFKQESIQEHVEQKTLSAARQACVLADLRKVDAIVIHKRVTSNLEGFLRGDLSSSLLDYCVRNPIWFTEGEIDLGKIAICIVDQEAALRITDHAGYMLAGSETEITLLHAAKTPSRPISCRPSEVAEKLADYADTAAKRVKVEHLMKAVSILSEYGFDDSTIRITLIPDRGDTAHEILSWCGSNGIGIIGLGHTPKEGTWGFLKTSVAKKILGDFKNMAVWVSQ